VAVKLLDYKDRAQDLQAEPNPFAALIVAHLKAQETRRSPEERRTWKLRLVKNLYDRGLTADDIQQLFRLIDWMLTLPAELEASFLDEMHRFEGERKMPYVTSVEKLGIKRGRKEGLQEGRKEGLREGLLETIPILLQTKFGAVDQALMEEIQALKDLDKLRSFARALQDVRTVKQARAMLKS
jgi:hypothetical protein